MCAKFVSLKASYPLIKRTLVPNMGRWIIYTESTKNSYRILKKYKYKRYKLRTKQGLSLTGLTNRIFLHTNKKKYFAHRIHSSTLWSSEKLPVQNTQSASCSSSSVESSAKGTVSSVSESDRMSDGVGSRQTLLFCHFEGPRVAFDASRLVLDLVVCLIFFFWVVPTKFL